MKETKVVMVTGGSGFIGSHTIVELLNNNFSVVAVDNFCNSKPYVIDNIKKITGKDFRFYNCDLTNLEDLDAIFENEQIDAIIHFAALKSGAESIENPGLYYHNNIDGLFNLLIEMKKHGVNNIVFSSSATVYGNDENVPILENHQIGNVISPYGMTKYLGELLLESSVRQNKQLNAIALRYFNPIGAHPSGLIGEDSPFNIPNNLMLYTLKVALGELPQLKVFGNDYNTPDGTGIRDFIHVVDLATGHIAAINRLSSLKNKYEVYNLGTGNGHSVVEFIETFERVNKVKVPYIFTGRRPGDVEKSFACVDRATKYLKWRATHSLEDCVRDSWNFVKTKR